MSSIDVREGRRAFGRDPDGYHEGRPDYPGWMFDALESHGALFPGAATVEIGAGSGLATRHLIERGASPLVLLEPDQRFHRGLRSLIEATDASGRCRIFHDTLEAAWLDAGIHDLVIAATSFHWLDPRSRVGRIHELLRVGGCAALMWNVFGDPDRADPFHEATSDLLAPLATSPSGGAVPFALDRPAREAEFLTGGRFALVLHEVRSWSLALDPSRVRKLYAGFSSIARLPEAQRDALLDRLAEIAEQDFAGTVIRNMTSPLYLFRRR